MKDVSLMPVWCKCGCKVWPGKTYTVGVNDIGGTDSVNPLNILP